MKALRWTQAATLLPWFGTWFGSAPWFHLFSKLQENCVFWRIQAESALHKRMWAHCFYVLLRFLQLQTNKNTETVKIRTTPSSFRGTRLIANEVRSLETTWCKKQFNASRAVICDKAKSCTGNMDLTSFCSSHVHELIWFLKNMCVNCLHPPWSGCKVTIPKVPCLVNSMAVTNTTKTSAKDADISFRVKEFWHTKDWAYVSCTQQGLARKKLQGLDFVLNDLLTTLTNLMKFLHLVNWHIAVVELGFSGSIRGTRWSTRTTGRQVIPVDLFNTTEHNTSGSAKTSLHWAAWFISIGSVACPAWYMAHLNVQNSINLWCVHFSNGA